MLQTISPLVGEMSRSDRGGVHVLNTALESHHLSDSHSVSNDHHLQQPPIIITRLAPIQKSKVTLQPVRHLIEIEMRRWFSMRKEHLR